MIIDAFDVYYIHPVGFFFCVAGTCKLPFCVERVKFELLDDNKHTQVHGLYA